MNQAPEQNEKASAPSGAVRWRVRLEKHRSTWYYTTCNPQGGSFGSNYCGPKHIALARAIRNIPDGEPYRVNGARFVRQRLKGNV